MQRISYPDIRQEKNLPVYVTAVGLEASVPEDLQVSDEQPRLLLTLSGRARMTVEGQVREFRGGNLLFLAPGERCACLSASEDFRAHWLLFAYGRGDFSETLFGPRRACCIVLGDPAAEDSAFRSMYSMLAQEAIYRGWSASAELYRVLLHMSRLSAEQSDQTQKKKKNNPALAAILDYIHAHYAEELTLEKLCTIAGGLSEQYLCRLFKQATGMRPVEYILKKRIAAARAYLENTDMPIAEVATAAGFHNTSYFYRNFKKFTGYSPLACRQISRQKKHGE